LTPSLRRCFLSDGAGVSRARACLSLRSIVLNRLPPPHAILGNRLRSPFSRVLEDRRRPLLHAPKMKSTIHLSSSSPPLTLTTSSFLLLLFTPPPLFQQPPFPPSWRGTKSQPRSCSPELNRTSTRRPIGGRTANETKGSM
jgi:hypothetical protein